MPITATEDQMQQRIMTLVGEANQIAADYEAEIIIKEYGRDDAGYYASIDISFCGDEPLTINEPVLKLRYIGQVRTGSTLDDVMDGMFLLQPCDHKRKRDRPSLVGSGHDLFALIHI